MIFRKMPITRLAFRMIIFGELTCNFCAFRIMKNQSLLFHHWAVPRSSKWVHKNKQSYDSYDELGGDLIRMTLSYESFIRQTRNLVYTKRQTKRYTTKKS